MDTAKVVSDLCDKLGTTAEKLLPEYGKYLQMSSGIACLLCIAILVIAILAGVAVLKKVNDEDAFNLAIFIGIAFTAGMAIVFSLNFHVFLSTTVNPGMAALQSIMNEIGG